MVPFNTDGFIGDRDELHSILGHRFIAGILEMQVSYETGDLEWHLLELVKDVDVHAVANYVLTNDLGKLSNTKHRRWARAFLRSIKRTIRRLRRSHFFGFVATTHFPTPKKRRSRRATKSDRENDQKEEKKQQGPKRTGTFKYGLEVPKNWKDLLRTDEAAGNHKWQEAVERW